MRTSITTQAKKLDQTAAQDSSSLLTAHLRKATGLSPDHIEKGRHAVTNLERDNILRRGDSTDPDTDEFIAGIHNIEQEVRENGTHETLEGTQCRQTPQKYSVSIRPGAYAYLSTRGISMPVDKQLSLVSFRLRPPATSRIHDVLHYSLLKPAHDSQSLGVRGTQLPVATDSVEYAVGKLLDKTWAHHGMDGIPNEGLLIGTRFQLEEIEANSRGFQQQT
jgi:hypothetical protein